MHNVKTEIMNQVSDSNRDNNRLVGGNFAQRAAIQMIEMRVCHQDCIDLRQVMDLEPRLL